jgi:very-short-patch-repair endonuclease
MLESNGRRDRTVNRLRGAPESVAEAARLLRKRSTPAESALWDALKARRLRGLRFRYQHPVGPFILDFYCPAAKLVVEVDGDSHLQRLSYDLSRTDQLRSYGYRVLRFTNELVLNDLGAVLREIERQASIGPLCPT